MLKPVKRESRVMSVIVQRYVNKRRQAWSSQPVCAPTSAISWRLNHAKPLVESWDGGGGAKGGTFRKIKSDTNNSSICEESIQTLIV
jgi:hypothetical protein